jgi:Bacterial PH domain
MSHDDYATEVSPGLPEHLPKGEEILWQGAPDWRALAWRTYHVREVIWYFALLIAWAGFRAWWETGLIGKGIAAAGFVVIPALVSVALLGLLAWLAARSTVYTLTQQRLVMRFGVVLPMTFNLPFTVIDRADADLRADGSGDIAVGLKPGQTFSYFVLWPHARPWRLRNAEPTMRALADGQKVATKLGQALKAAAGQAAEPVPGSSRPVAQPRPAYDLGLQGHAVMSQAAK